MTKIVRYNGGTMSYCGCSKPTDLEVGKEYVVDFERKFDWQTNYILKGIVGEFNSTWFDEVNSNNNIYMAIANGIPEINKSCHCYKLEIRNGNPELVSWFTSDVQKIEDMGNSIYKVTTLNSVYIVKVF